MMLGQRQSGRREPRRGVVDRKTVQTAVMVITIVVLLGTLLFREINRNRNAPPEERPDTGPADPSVHLTMGNPSGATDDPGTPNNFLMRKPYFALSYNDSRGGPNWVSWCLRQTDFGTAARSEFYPDPDLPKGFRHVTPKDYTGTGFDRGHLCPRSDRTATPEMANATFVMTNIVPQSPHLNQRGWNDFEEYSRGLVRKGHTLYIVAGGQGTGGEGTNGRAESIAGGHVTVPAKCWKVVMVVENGTGGADDIGRIGPETRVIAVVMRNDQTIGHDWSKYRTSVNEVETLTGYKFFARVSPAVIDPLKAKVDDTHIPPVGKAHHGD